MISTANQVQEELVTEQTTARERIDHLDAEGRDAVAAATRLAGELEDKCRELTQCVEYLHAAERTVEERTAWAQRNQAELDALRANRWTRLGFKLRMLPKPQTGN